MLFLENGGTYTAWRGEAIGDVRHPLNIEQLWTAQELAALGLYNAEAAAPLADGKIADGAPHVALVSGVVRWVQPSKNAPTPTLAERRADAIHRAGNRWDAAEKGGTSAMGLSIRTDAEGQAKITGGIVAFTNDPTLGSVPYELTPGVWLDVDEPTLCALGVVVAQHVKACAARARVISEALAAASTKTALDAAIAEIDTGWPE